MGKTAFSTYRYDSYFWLKHLSLFRPDTRSIAILYAFPIPARVLENRLLLRKIEKGALPMCFRPPTIDEGPVKCPMCGAEVDPKLTECPSCGAKAAPAPGMPTPPGVPSAPGAPSIPKVPSVPKAPKAPSAPPAPKVPLQ